MIQPINHDTTSLQQKSTSATTADRAIVQDLLDTLSAHQADCVGMAANMIGAHKRIIVCRLGLLNFAMVNPVILHRSNPYTTEEGCLSLSGTRTTQRFKTITVQYLDGQFSPKQQVFSDYLAQIIQHEIDHCDGRLI